MQHVPQCIISHSQGYASIARPSATCAWHTLNVAQYIAKGILKDEEEASVDESHVQTSTNLCAIHAK